MDSGNLKRGKGERENNYYQCPMPNAQCPLKNKK
jgi:hypothetical protein